MHVHMAHTHTYMTLYTWHTRTHTWHYICTHRYRVGVHTRYILHNSGCLSPLAMSCIDMIVYYFLQAVEKSGAAGGGGGWFSSVSSFLANNFYWWPTLTIPSSIQSHIFELITFIFSSSCCVIFNIHVFMYLCDVIMISSILCVLCTLCNNIIPVVCVQSWDLSQFVDSSSRSMVWPLHCIASMYHNNNIIHLLRVKTIRSINKLWRAILQQENDCARYTVISASSSRSATHLNKLVLPDTPPSWM